MTSPSPSASDEPAYADRTYRSGAGVAAGVLLLLLALWLAGDAMFRGHGRTPWVALAGLVFAVPLVVAFTLRPAVFTNAARVRVRNPFRTVELPWAQVADVRAAYSTELVAGDGATFQMWAVPVSLRARKRAVRQAGRPERGGIGGTAAPRPAAADQAVSDFRKLIGDAQSAGRPAGTAGGTPRTVRWAYEIIAPAVVGAVALVVLFSAT
ncbi:PH domain-containing protein [uncultured Streptomyces sp.]|uniref:PH domain-containing protein n=1 Tax=uncultured Streptomyces sp. TaxID=174707 RepID=UPI0026042373|nr:PH domain-containing protein [uncultured Streptomyces sp.]